MHHQRQTKSPYLLALCGFLLTASAGVLATPDEHASAQVSEAVQSALARLIESGDVSAEALEGLHVDIDSFRTARFGALIEGRFTAEEDRLGVRVLAVADASAASQMGLRKGDRIQAVAGTSLLQARRCWDWVRWRISRRVPHKCFAKYWRRNRGTSNYWSSVMASAKVSTRRFSPINYRPCN